jgi:uncharacterized membrane protein
VRYQAERYVFARMNPAPAPAPRRKSSRDPWKVADDIVFALFLATLAVALGETIWPSAPAWLSDSAELSLALFATASTLISLSRRLPGQNVLLATGIIAVIGTVTQVIGVKTAIPFGPIVYRAAGPLLSDTVPWFVPLVWVVAVLNARAVARMMARPWRKTRNYGVRIIVLTILLALAFELAFEPFATQVKHYWLWTPTKLRTDWFGTPITDFLGWLVTLSLIISFATPAMIDKGHRKLPPNYKPLLLWIGLNALFAAGAASQGLWLAVIVTAGVALVGTVFAVRGARW